MGGGLTTSELCHPHYIKISRTKNTLMRDLFPKKIENVFVVVVVVVVLNTAVYLNQLKRELIRARKTSRERKTIINTGRYTQLIYTQFSSIYRLVCLCLTHLKETDTIHSKD